MSITPPPAQTPAEAFARGLGMSSPELTERFRRIGEHLRGVGRAVAEMAEPLRMASAASGALLELLDACDDPEAADDAADLLAPLGDHQRVTIAAAALRLAEIATRQPEPMVASST